MSKRKFIPTEDSSKNSDKKQKLELKLKKDGFRIKKILHDGNCLFTAIERLTGLKRLRASAVDYMRDNPQLFANFIDDSDTLESYINRMSLDRSWAGDMEILALANFLDVNIYVYNIDGTYTIIGPSSGSASVDIRILYNNYHFDAIVPDDFRERVSNPSAGIVDLIDDEYEDEDEIEEYNNGVILSKQKQEEVDKNKKQLKEEEYESRSIKGDGNCLFRAIAEQIEGYTQEDHELLREIAVVYLRQNINDFLELQRHDSMEEAIEYMATPGAWGGIFELQVLADFLERDIRVHGVDPCYVISRTKTITKDNIIDFEVFFDGSHFSAVLRPGFIPVNIDSGESLDILNADTDLNNDDLGGSTIFNPEASNNNSTNSLMSLSSVDDDSSSILGGIGLVMLRPFLTQDQIDLLFDM